ncbi:MAG: GNAT family N-acetyltransferase [Defluviitaleaceae bacterium]|nr:GNAT family N-acetyltransferase [Defluviitaleaceae bacterium]
MIKEVGIDDLPQAIALINEVFAEFVAVDYPEQGRITFENYLKTKHDELSSDLKSGHKKMWAYYQNGEINGVVAIRDISHIALMFVDKRHHKKGIARRMFNFILEEIKQNKDVTQITVSSSPYAVEFYERLGFIKTDGQQEKNGMIYIPMKYQI